MLWRRNKSKKKQPSPSPSPPPSSSSFSLSSIQPFSWISKLKQLSFKPNKPSKPIPPPTPLPRSASVSAPPHFPSVAPGRLSIDNDSNLVARHRSHTRHLSAGNINYARPFSSCRLDNNSLSSSTTSDSDTVIRRRRRRRRRRRQSRAPSPLLPIATRKSFSRARPKVRLCSPRTTRRKAVAAPEGRGLEGFAVVKKSRDPQRDFRESMVEMIWERGMERPEELEGLLACYLSLNSDEHHDVIVKVFRQVWFELNPGAYVYQCIM